MMIFPNNKSFLAVALALSAVTSSVHAQSCSFTRVLGDGTTADLSSVETFNPAAQAVTTCTVTCDTGGIASTFSLKYGGSVSSIPGPTFNDAFEINLLGCEITTQIISASEEQSLGWAYANTVGGYTGLQISCTCDNPGDGPSSACFSGSTTVETEDRGVITMRDLQIGDSVLSASSAGGEPNYQPVYSFGHYHETQEKLFVQIFTQENARDPLEMSGDHLLFVVDESGNEKAVPADSVQVGDTLIQASSTEAPHHAAVTKIANVVKQGVYMPLTADGTIIVNNVKASSYVSLQKYAPVIHTRKAFYAGMMAQDDIFHWWMSPLRLLCQGVNAKFCDTKTANSYADRDHDQGISNYLLASREILTFVDGLPLLVQFFLAGVPAMAIFALLNSVEMIFGAAFAPTAVALMSVGLVAYWRNKRGQRDLVKKTA